MDTFRPTKVRIALGTALAVLAAAGILLPRDISRLSEIVRRAWQSSEVIVGLDNIFIAFRDSVSASRGYAPNAVQLHGQTVKSMQAALRNGRKSTRRIVELHGGCIWVESTVGECSRFFFTMPAANAGEPCSKQRRSWSTA